MIAPDPKDDSRDEPQEFLPDWVDGDVFWDSGLLNLQIDRNEIARDRFTRAIQLEPLCASSYSLRGQALMALGDLVAARADLDVAITMDSEDEDAFLHRGRCRFHQGELEGCRDDLLQARDLEPASAATHYWMGRTDLLRHANDIAITSLKRSVELDPSETLHHTWLARAYLQAGRRDQAREQLVLAKVAISADDLDWISMSRVHALCDDFDATLDALRRVNLSEHDFKQLITGEREFEGMSERLLERLS